MDDASALVRHLHPLYEPEHADAMADHLGRALSRLAADVAATVPSLLAASLTVTRHGEATTVTARTPPRGAPTPARRAVASLAVRLGPDGRLLVLRGAVSGAFLVLADDLAAALGGAGPAMVLDEHLTMPPPLADQDQVPAADVDDVRVIDRALGVLLDRGTPPDEGLADIERRAADAGLPLGVVARALVAGVVPPEV